MIQVKDLEFGTIAVGHGPLLRYNVDEIVGRCGTMSHRVQIQDCYCSIIMLMCLQDQARSAIFAILLINLYSPDARGERHQWYHQAHHDPPRPTHLAFLA